MTEDDGSRERHQVRAQLAHHRTPRRESQEEEQREQLECDFERIFGPPDPDIAAKGFAFSTGDEAPVITQKKVVADPGESVVLTGTYLTTVQDVGIGGLEVEQLAVSTEQIAFVVPPSVGPGRLTIVWLPTGGSELEEVQIDFDLKTPPPSGGYDSE